MQICFHSTVHALAIFHLAKHEREQRLVSTQLICTRYEQEISPPPMAVPLTAFRPRCVSIPIPEVVLRTHMARVSYAAVAPPLDFKKEVQGQCPQGSRLLYVMHDMLSQGSQAPIHLDIFPPGEAWSFRVRWDPAQQTAGEFWFKLQKRIAKKLSQNGSNVTKFVLSSLDGNHRVEDEDDFTDFVDIARDERSTKIQLHVIVVQVYEQCMRWLFIYLPCKGCLFVRVVVRMPARLPLFQALKLSLRLAFCVPVCAFTLLGPAGLGVC